ncbi:MAG: BON domain-containing protein [Nitrospiraceae bacterium]|nr:BON domain-containing protein [Nitrospiraceae bacterium]
MPTRIALTALLASVFLAAGCLGDKETRKKDQALTDAVQKALMDDEQANLHKVDVYTEDAVVYLGGDLSHFDQKARAGEVARKVPGVRDVFNKIQVEP